MQWNLANSVTKRARLVIAELGKLPSADCFNRLHKSVRVSTEENCGSFKSNEPCHEFVQLSNACTAVMCLCSCHVPDLNDADAHPVHIEPKGSQLHNAPRQRVSGGQYLHKL